MASSSNSSFILSLCDFHSFYGGCLPSTLPVYVILDSIYVFINVLIVLFYCFFISRRMYRHIKRDGLPLRDFVLNDLDKVCVLSILTHHFRIAWVVLKRSTALLPPGTPLSSQVSLLQTIIFLDFIFMGLAGLTLNQFTFVFIKLSASADLYAPFKWGKYVLDPSSALKIIRVSFLTLLLTWCICWCTLGTSSITLYILFRRLFHLTLTALSSLVSPIILWFFGMMVVEKLEGGGARTAPPVPIAAVATRIYREEPPVAAELNQQELQQATKIISSSPHHPPSPAPLPLPEASSPPASSPLNRPVSLPPPTYSLSSRRQTNKKKKKKQSKEIDLLRSTIYTSIAFYYVVSFSTASAVIVNEAWGGSTSGSGPWILVAFKILNDFLFMLGGFRSFPYLYARLK